MFEIPSISDPGIVERKSEESPESQLERAREFGEQYAGILEIAVGKKAERDMNQASLAPENQILWDAMQAFREKQSKRQEELCLDAQGLLRQAFQSEVQHQLLEDRTRYYLVELSPGIYSVIVDSDVFSKLMGGSQGVAIKIHDGVSFIMIPNFRNNQAFQQRIMEENIPHEVHHLIWWAVLDAGAFQSREHDSDFRKGFMMFQDELIARVSSDGGLGGYSHISLLSPQAREDLERAFPGKAEAILDRVGALNEFLEVLESVIMHSERVMKKDLLQVIVSSRTFDELEAGLYQMKLLIERFPMKERTELGHGLGFDAPIV